MERNYCVYMHTNKLNNKKYIGITSRAPEDRWHKGQGYKRQRKFWNAINKYGWDGFEHDILFTGLTLDEANAKERELIKEYDSHAHGYNDTDGGDGTLGHLATPEARAKMSKSRKGRVIDEKWRRNLSIALSGKHHNLSCDTLTESHKNNISNSLKEYHKKNPDAFKDRVTHVPIPVICDGIKYESVEVFSQVYALKKSSVYKWLNGTIYIPEEFVIKKIHYEGTNPTYEESYARDSKIFYNGTIYDSMAQCARETHKAPNTLKAWINGTKTSENEVYYVPVKQYKIKF